MQVFVYGSLKKGYALHHLLEDQQFLGLARTLPLYRIYDLGEYPGLIDVPDGLEIHGEVYEVSAEALERLDAAEGVSDGYYARRQIQLLPPFDQSTTHAWFWLRAVKGCRDCGVSWP